MCSATSGSTCACRCADPGEELSGWLNPCFGMSVAGDPSAFSGGRMGDLPEVVDGRSKDCDFRVG